MMRRLKATVIVLAMGFVGTARPQAPPPKPLVLMNVTLIDVTGGGPPARAVTVVITGDRITSVGESGKASVPRGARVVNAAGKYLIPGLWDMHVHLSWMKATALAVLVANGVTSVRDMGGRLGEIDAWRAEVAAGLKVGPRVLRAGPMLNGRSFNTLQMVPGNPDETRGVVRALKEVGVDFIKVHRRMVRESYFAAVDESKKLGLTLVGHIPMTVTPEEASDAGQVTFEHTETLFEGTFSERNKDRKLPDAIREFRAREADKLFARFVKNGTAVDPTLVAYRSLVELSDPASPPNPLGRYVPLSLRREWEKRAREQPVSAADLAELKQTSAELLEVVRQMHKAGVILLAGSDTAGPLIPGFSLHDELALLVEAGLTPLEALRAATLTPARVMKREKDLGTIGAGKLADLVLLDANPLEDIRNTRRIRAVVLNGKLLDRAALDRLLAEAARDALRN